MKPARRQQRQAIRLSRRGQQIVNTFSAAELEIYPFTSGIVDFSAFPIGVWRRLQHKHWRMAYPDMLDYSYSGGHVPLRNAVVGYLRVFRNLSVDVEQVFVTNGTQQSIELCAQILADHNDTVWLEDPAYWGAVKAFVAAGLHLHPVLVDDLGMAPIISKTVPAPRLVYVTPSHQYPMGVVMPISRRQEILAVARKYEAWVLEDDYDSEFRFSGPAVETIASLDTDQRVIYMGSFSKVLYPGLKLGYIVVPKGLAAPMKQAHYDLNRPGQIPLQAALAEFIEMGHFTRALRGARHSYAEHRRCLLDALKPCLGTLAHISGAEQGLHLCVNLPSAIDDKALAQRIGSTGLSVRALSAYCVSRKDLRGLVIGYGYAPLAEIKRLGPTLAKSINAALSSFRREG